MIFPWLILKSPNPVFESELAHVRWIPSRKGLIAYSLGVLAISMILAVLIGIVRTQPIIQNIYTAMPNFAFFSLIAAPGSNVIADFYYCVMPMLRMSRDRASGQWEVLRTIPLGKGELVEAKYAIFQICAWRAMMLTIGLDLIFLGFGLYHMFDFSTLIAHTNPSPGFTMISLLVAVLQTGIVSLYRMRALTAIGLSTGLQSDDLTYNYNILFLWLGGLFVVLLLISCLTQFGIFELVRIQLANRGASLYDDYYFNLYSILEAVATLVTILASCCVYRFIQWAVLRHAIVL